MKIIIILALLLSSSLFSQSMSAQERSDYKSAFLGEIDDIYGEGQSYHPNDIKEQLILFTESLYLNGYAKKEAYEQFDCKVKELLAMDSLAQPESRECIFEAMSSSTCNTNVQTSSYSNAANASCNNDGLVTNATGVVSIDTSSGSKPLKKRFDVWRKVYGKFSDFVFAKMDQFPGVKVNAKENATVSLCRTGLVRSYDSRILSGASCKKTQQSCSGHLDCCTGKCIKDSVTDSSGTCSEAYTCYAPISLNNKCGDIAGDGYVNQICSSGSCLKIDYNSSDMGSMKKAGESCTNNSQCRSDLCKNLKCEDQSKCLLCAYNGETPSANKSCCPGLIKSLNNKCIPDFPVLILPNLQTSAKNILKSILNLIIPSAAASESEQDCTTAGNNLTDAQESEYSNLVANCMSKPEDERQACLNDASTWRSNLLNQGNGNDCTWDRQTYLERYNATAITSKTYSDVKQCKFNSFNDTWRDMSNVQRNAELVTRAFEYVFTGSGTEDYWVNSQKKNIYSRAKSVARKLRKSRSAFMAKMKETDIKMACQCIAIYGADKFPDRADFFNSIICQDQRAAISQMGIGNVSGSSQSSDAITAQAGQIAETDMGAIGLSHEKMLLEWLQMKYDNQIERFTTNIAIEQEMTDLIDALNNQVWSKSLLVNTPLYDFTVWKYRGFWRFVLQAVNVALAPAMLASLGPFGADWMQSIFTGVWGKTSFENGIMNGEINDTPKNNWSARGRLFKKYRDYRRDYIGPHYKNFSQAYRGENLSLPSSLKCDVRGESSSCFKNAHKTEFDGEERFLIDIKNPLFANLPNSMMDTGYIKKVNDGYNRGIAKLKSFRPSGDRHVRFLNDNHLLKKDVMKTFLPGSGNYKPSAFTDVMKNKILAGVTKFANCKKLSDCGVSDEDYKDDYGFGELFESSTDVENFAAYVYQHHFHWPSLSATSFLGYPLMAQRAYFEVMTFNIRLVGSLAAAQGAGYGQAYDKYKTDWDARKAAYSATGKVEIGYENRNAVYRTEFRSTFNTLNFNNGSGLTSFDKLYNSGVASGSFNKAELAALNAGKNKAIASAQSQKRRANYEKQTKGSARAKLKETAQASLLNSFGAPLNKSGLTVGGQDLGQTGDIYQNNGKLIDSKGTSSKLASTKQKDSQKTTSNNAAASYSVASYNNSGFNSGAHNDYASYSDGDANDTKPLNESIKKSTGLSQEEIDRMLVAAEKDKKRNLTEDGDGLFKVVSKAYKRNYDVFFARKQIILPDTQTQKKSEINDTKKDKLKNLLKN